VVNRKTTQWETQQAARVKSSGVWTPLGAAIEPSNATLCKAFTGEPNVIYDSTDRLYKMLYSAGDNVTVESVALATSPTGLPGSWTNYASNPVVTGKTRSSGAIKVGALWYMTAQVGAGTALDLLSSPDLITWSVAQASIIVPTAAELGFYNSCLRYESGTWYLFYDYQTTDPTYIYATGLATSTNGTTFTRATNPIITHASSIGATGTAGGMYVYHKPGGKWYAWGQCALVVVPTDIVRFEADDAAGPWTQSTTGLSFPRHDPSTGWFNTYGQVADVSIVACATGGTLMYFAALNTASAQTEIHVAHSPLALDQIVDTDEGISPEYRPQMIVNGSFETVGAGGADVVQGWVESAGDGAITRTTMAGEVHTDTCKLAALKLTAGAGMATVVQQTWSELVPGRNYTLSGWARGDGTHPGLVRVQSIASGTPDLIPWLTSLTTTSATYAPFAFPFVAPPCGSVICSLVCPQTSGGFACFDDLSVQQL
jgi:hypothetical protein